MKTCKERWRGGERLGREGIFTSVDFSVQSDGLREVEEARIAMIKFVQDVDIPPDLRRCTSSPKSQRMTYIPLCINLATTNIKASETRNRNQWRGGEGSGSENPLPFNPWFLHPVAGSGSSASFLHHCCCCRQTVHRCRHSIRTQY